MSNVNVNKNDSIKIIKNFIQDLSFENPQSVNENNFVDFDRDRLLFHMSSSEGSCICEGDINNDGALDIIASDRENVQLHTSNAEILFVVFSLDNPTRC